MRILVHSKLVESESNRQLNIVVAVLKAFSSFDLLKTMSSFAVLRTAAFRGFVRDIIPAVSRFPYRMASSTSTQANFDSATQQALKLGRLNHVAIATPNLEQATAMYRDVLGANVSKPEDLPDHGVTTVFVDLGNTKIELLHPLGKQSPIQNFLDKNKAGGIHHICIEVDDIYSAVESLKASGKIRVLDPKPKIGAHGKPVVFLHPKDCGGVLLELEQA